MHSFVIVSHSQKKRQRYLLDFAQERKISQFDQKSTIPDTSSIGIESIRNLLLEVNKKPFNSKEKMIVIEDAQKLTLESQNALLKVLEEPPADTYLFLSATTDEIFLPTILSRCKIVHLDDGTKKEISPEDIEKIDQILQEILSGNIGMQMALAEELAAQKENLIRILEQCILLLRDKMLEKPHNQEAISLVEKLQKAHMLVQTTNVNPRVILEHILLTIN